MRIDCDGIGDGLRNMDQLRPARDSIVKNGYVVLDRVIADTKISALAEAFSNRHETFDSHRRLGERRFAVAVELAGPFADAVLYANPAILTVVREVLDQDAVLEAVDAMVIFPGAGPQHIHRDGCLLFDSALSPLLPAHALTVVLPLGHQRVALWPESHRWKVRGDDVPPDVVELPAGSALVRDCRLFCSDMGNRADRHVIALQIIYARPWYRNSGDLLRGDRAPLLASHDFLVDLGTDERRLFAHVELAGTWNPSS